MKFLIIDTYYPAFLQSFWARNPGIKSHSYAEQWRTLMDECFGTADYYSTNLKKLGHEATELVANCPILQLTWAQEHSLRLHHKIRYRKMAGLQVPWIERDWYYPVLLEQVKAHSPDVIHFQDPGSTDPSFLREIRPFVRLITAQIACPFPAGTDFTQYDLMLSSFPHFVDQFKRQGLQSEYFNLAFEPRILMHVQKTQEHDVVFVGGVSPAHADRMQFLEKIASRVKIDWWGYGVEYLAHDSALRRSHREPVWALEMYDKLHNARIALNHHIDVSKNCANNMRLFEATGVATCLVTDHKDNLETLFQPGKEVLAYRSVEECVEMIAHYLAHEEERKAIAEAGQARTLKEHTYFQRMKQFASLAEYYLRRQSERTS
jgi:hypothetical protein